MHPEFAKIPLPQPVPRDFWWNIYDFDVHALQQVQIFRRERNGIVESFDNHDSVGFGSVSSKQFCRHESIGNCTAIFSDVVWGLVHVPDNISIGEFTWSRGDFDVLLLLLLELHLVAHVKSMPNPFNQF